MKRNSSIFFSFFPAFFTFLAFFCFFRFFLTFFRLIFVSLRFFHLIFAYFTFVFASDFRCFASKWIMWNQAFFSLPSETKFSLQFQISLPKRKWGRTLVPSKWYCQANDPASDVPSCICCAAAATQKTVSYMGQGIKTHILRICSYGLWPNG